MFAKTTCLLCFGGTTCVKHIQELNNQCCEVDVCVCADCSTSNRVSQPRTQYLETWHIPTWPDTVVIMVWWFRQYGNVLIMAKGPGHKWASYKWSKHGWWYGSKLSWKPSELDALTSLTYSWHIAHLYPKTWNNPM